MKQEPIKKAILVLVLVNKFLKPVNIDIKKYVFLIVRVSLKHSYKIKYSFDNF